MSNDGQIAGKSGSHSPETEMNNLCFPSFVSAAFSCVIISHFSFTSCLLFDRDAENSVQQLRSLTHSSYCNSVLFREIPESFLRRYKDCHEGVKELKDITLEADFCGALVQTARSWYVKACRGHNHQSSPCNCVTIPATYMQNMLSGEWPRKQKQQNTWMMPN